MSSRTVLRFAAAARPSASMVSRRAIATTPRLAHKESSHEHPTSEDVSRHKDDLLGKHKQGKGHWKPELASNSEEAVKADRESHKGESTHDHVKKLQEKTKHHAEQSSKSGTSTSDPM